MFLVGSVEPPISKNMRHAPLKLDKLDHFSIFPYKNHGKNEKKTPPRGYFSGLKWWKRFGETCRKLSSSLGSVHQHVQVPEMDVLMHLSNTDSKNP